VTVDRDASRQIVAVTGLAREARIASGPGIRTLTCGGSTPVLSAALQRELTRGALGVISFGIAGGLAEGVASGTWLIARAVVTAVARWPCDPAWSRTLSERLPEAMTVDLAGADAPIMESAAKLALNRATGAVAVDTESHVAAALAARHGLPFVALRVIADSARHALPPLAAIAVATDGTIRPAAALRSLARAPEQIPSLLRTAVDARAAFRALLRGRRLLGPGLAYPDLGELQLDVV
jgi:hopanoid-associated phosphorylase